MDSFLLKVSSNIVKFEDGLYIVSFVVKGYESPRDPDDPFFFLDHPFLVIE